MSKLDRLHAMIWKHEDLWSSLVQHNPRSAGLRSWFVEVWSPWYVRWLNVRSRCRTGKDCPGLLEEASQGLSGLRERAREANIPLPDIATVVGKRRKKAVRDQRSVKGSTANWKPSASNPVTPPPTGIEADGGDGGDEGDDVEEGDEVVSGGWLHYIDPRHLAHIVEAHKNEIAAVSNLVAPGSGSALLGVFAMKDQVEKARKGDPKAQKFIKHMAYQAAKGNPDAKQAMDTASHVIRTLEAA